MSSKPQNENRPRRMDTTLICFVFCALAAGCAENEVNDLPSERSNIVTSRMALTADERNVRADEFYALDNMLTIDIYMDPDDWDELRNAEPYGGRCVPEYVGDRYDDYEPARVVITGSDPSRTVDISNTGTKNVEVQKKGWCSSANSIKPALKLKFKSSVEDEVRDKIGVKKVMLNNSTDDPAYIRQCVGYRLLKEAGVPYSRCNFARVRVNGEDVAHDNSLFSSLYVNVEPVDKMMLYNNFGNMDGNDYEFDIGEDFISEMIPRVEVESVSAFDNKEDFILAVDELAADRLDSVFDMDAFIKFYAMEFLLGHYDSYPGNQNNIHVYNDVAAVEHPVVANGDVNFKFIPWGIDSILGIDYHPEIGLYQKGRLAEEVNNLAAGHLDLYLAFQHQVYMYLGSVFNPKALEGELGAWIHSVATAAEAVVPGTQIPSDAADEIIDFMMQRRADVNEWGFDVTLPSTAVRIEGANDECAHRGDASVGTDQWSMDHLPCSTAAGDAYLFELVESTTKPGYYKLAYTEGGASFTFGARADDTHKLDASNLNDLYYGRLGSNTDYPQYFGIVPVGIGSSRLYEIQSVETELCWRFSEFFRTSEGNLQVYQYECNSNDKNLVDFVEPPPAPPCNASTAQDLGYVGQESTVATDGCVKVQDHYPWYWGTSRRMKLQNSNGNGYPVPFTWSNACSGGNGTDAFAANWNDKWFNNIDSTCATVIDLQGPSGGSITLRYWAE